VEGEGTLGTSPSDSESASAAGDVAPLGFQTVASHGGHDGGKRLLSNAALLNSLAGDRRDITLEAADLDHNGAIESGDLLKILNAVEAQALVAVIERHPSNERLGMTRHHWIVALLLGFALPVRQSQTRLP